MVIIFTSVSATVNAEAFVNVWMPIFPASIWFSSPEMFLSFFDFACARRGFFPTHFSVCFPPILQLEEVVEFFMYIADKNNLFRFLCS